MVARIYSPAKNAMQSGRSNTGSWVLEYVPETAKMIEPLMGYTSTVDMKAQVKLKFDSKETAIAFATKNGISFQIEEPHEAKRRSVSYSDNFKANRQAAWTH